MIDFDVMDAYRKCRLCPNFCGVDRTVARGRCGDDCNVRIAWSGLHRGEEPFITGRHGSGMIFFSGCPLHCRFCQNHQISRKDDSVGFEISAEELAHLMLELQKQGANNINMVTGTQYIPSIAYAIEISRKEGMTLPIVWNTSGYESVEGLEIIDRYVDCYLIDLKTLDEKVAEVFCGTANYARVIRGVFEYLVERHPRYEIVDDCHFRGLLVRHLVFPGTLKATRKVLRYFAEKLNGKCMLSFMVQFVPPLGDVTFKKMSEDEYDSILYLMEDLGIDDGFIQELGDEDDWIPDFRKDIPFPRSFCDVNRYFLELKKKNNKTNE